MNLPIRFLVSAALAIGVCVPPYLRAQDAAPPVEAAFHAGGTTWQFNGLGQVRFSRPAVRTFDLPWSQYSITGSLGEKTTVFVQGGASSFGSGDAFLLEAWVARQLSASWRLQAGRFTLPFSRQYLISPADLLLPDISSADAAFNAPYAWGAMASLDLGRTTWTAAAITGVTPLDSITRARPVGNPGVVARVDLNVLKPFGYKEADPSAREPQLSFGLAGMYSTSAFDSPLQNLVRGDRIRNFTADFGFRAWRVTAQAAVYRRAAEARLARARTDWGGYAQSGFYLIPARLELAGRVGTVHFAAHELSSGTAATERTLGLNYYLRGNFIKTQADYTWYSVRPFGPPTPGGQLRVQAQFGF